MIYSLGETFWENTNLKEAGNVPFIIDTHCNHVLKHPEEGSVLSFFWLGFTQQAIELKEQAAGPFCKQDTHRVYYVGFIR